MRAIVAYLGTLENVARYYDSDNDITILEIGVARGMSTRYMLKALWERNHNRKYGKGILYSIDIQDCRDNVERGCRILGIPGALENWRFIHQDSKTAKWDKEIDVLFIDGDHSYKGVKADYEKYEPFVKKGGLILMHDVTYPRYGVKDFWKEIKYPKAILNINAPGLGIVNKI